MYDAGKISLSRCPTPLHRLSRLSEELGADIWVKRDDLTGFELSGNKVRKLEYLLADALAVEADTVLTTGGLQSNHARATAFAARQLGLEPCLLLRGEQPAAPDSNLLLARLAGAVIRTCSAEDYRERRDALLESWAQELRSQGRRFYVIPEGGSNGLGALGFIHAARELMAQADGPFDRVVVPVGSGGTLAGLAMAGLPGEICGVAVCDDAPYFEAQVRRIAAEGGALGAGPLRAGGWSVLEGYQGPGYAIAGPEVWETIAWVARAEGLILDPVYTGKAMHALTSEVRAGRWSGRTLFWHTGGAFGVFGRGAELPSS
jgi:D-cysteine desulfhydrase